MSKPKLLVEIISLSQRAATTLAQLINEAIGTFTKKADHFSGQLRNYEPAEDGDIKLDSEDTLMVTNAEDKLNYVFKSVVESIDLNLTKENTNAGAVGIIEVNDKVWVESIPVNAILTAETAIKRLRDLILAVPTLEPKENWSRSKDHKPALYTSEKKTRLKSKKVETFQTVAEATKDHPAQVQKVYNDVIAGKWETTLLSGKIRPFTKSQMLKRVDKLSGIFQNARESANNAEVKELKLGTKIRDYIMEPLKEELK
jgi:hypothetical protein